MFLTEYNEEKVLAKERNEGIQTGIQTGQQLRSETVATNMLKEGGQSISYISRMTLLSEESVQKLAKTLGIVV